MTTATTPAVDDLRMACPMRLIVGVAIEHIRHEDGTVDRKIALVLDCGCRFFVSLPLHKRAPRRGEPSHCRMAHGPFQAEEPA